MKITANFVVDTSTATVWTWTLWRVESEDSRGSECSQAGCWHTLHPDPGQGHSASTINNAPHCPVSQQRPAQSVVLSSSAAITDQMNALQRRGHTLLVLLLSAFSFNQPILSEIIRSLCTICCRISCAVWRVLPDTAQLAAPPPVTQPSWLCGCQACCSGVPSSHSSDQFVFVNVC